MRLLVVLHEDPVGSHADSRRALSSLVELGQLQEYAIFPFLSELRAGRLSSAVEDRIVQAAADFRAACVLWCHTGRFEVSNRTLHRLRSLPERPVMGYWEGDMYQWPYKPFPAPAKRLACASDAVFLPGSSSLSRSLRRAGCLDIRYTPLPTDPGRFGGAMDARKRNPEFDIVLVGNNPTSRIPLKTMPGARWRSRIVAMLQRRLGTRFAVFGSGWSGPCAQGPIPHASQGEAYARSRAAIGVNNLRADYYFSDRLPVSLTCGAVTLHNWERGLDRVFGPKPPIRFFRSSEEAWAEVRRILEADEVDLSAERVRGRALALSRFTFRDVLSYIMLVMAAHRESRLEATSTGRIANPWIGREQL